MSGETIDGGAPYEFDDNKDLRDLVPDAQTEGGIMFTLPEGYRPAHSLDEVVGQVNFVQDTPDGVEVNYTPVEPTDADEAETSETEAGEAALREIASLTEVQGINPSGSPAKLNKRSVLMNLSNEDELGVHFVHLDETGGVSDSIYMQQEMWSDLGTPETITVVVYPKDMLN